MSLYSLWSGGLNPFAGILLGSLGFKQPLDEIDRFRDCYVDADDNIVVFTRTGGQNRDQYQAGNQHLAERADFLRTEDWSEDGTYAKFVYQPPEEVRELTRQLGEAGARSDPTQKFRAFLADMDSEAPKPSTRAALERARPLIEQMGAALSSGARVVTVRDEESR